jgi:hypothetical protein
MRRIFLTLLTVGAGACASSLELEHRASVQESLAQEEEIEGDYRDAEHRWRKAAEYRAKAADRRNWEQQGGYW